MLKLIRILLVLICSISISVIGIFYALIRFRNPNCVGEIARWYSYMHALVGIKLIRRPKTTARTPAIYIANHQNNYDMVTISSMVPEKTVTIGKKSLIWIPFFGLVYWATGNIFINREKRSSAISTMTKVGEIIRQRQISIWMFPEGTRSRRRGLLPFKTGAFHTAIAAGVPIIPIVCSTLHKKVDLNRWDNGTVICEELDPIDTSGYNRDNLKELIEHCHNIMQNRIAELDAEIAALDKK
nr:1-acylglycerol-3-phosphate O-acyltransferase [uncultured Haemophilus sp.]